MRKPFQLKNRRGWHGEVVHADGRTERRHFEAHRDAVVWVEAESAKAKAAQAPLFGGPSGLVLGRLLAEYAGRFTICKDGFAEELSRINHYVTAAGLPRLKFRVDAAGKRYLETMSATASPALPSGFKAHIDARLAQRARTYTMLGELARKKVSKITADDMVLFHATMKSDGLSVSTIQKEMALLKAAFNAAIKFWKWKQFENPCVGISLGGSERRFVVLSNEDKQRLYQALSECDNPQFWPLVELAIVSTLRKGTLLTMTWEQINLETCQARLWAKGKWVDVTLSPRACEVLKRVPPNGTNRVFTMTRNAVDMAWDGVRIKAGLRRLQFRDLRHVGATFYAQAGLSVHQLKDVLTHSTTRMAEIYVNVTGDELSKALAAADAKRDTPNSMPPVLDPNGPKKKPRRRKGANAQPAAPQPQRNVIYLIRDGTRLVREDAEEAPASDTAAPPSPLSGAA